jgi:Holliday junction resolvase RusA-like endonuclease
VSATVVTLEIPGTPVAKARPRSGRGHFYTPRKTQAAEAAIAWHAKIAGVTFVGPVRVQLDFYGGRGDADNLTKTALDGAQKGGLFLNDSQVQKLGIAKYPADGNPRTIMRVEAL